MNEQESLDIILNMVNKAKKGVNETGISSILWGSVIGICGIFSFLELQFKWDTGNFDIWILTLVALIPYIYLIIRERKNKGAKSYLQEALDAVWTTYMISVFGLWFYLHFAPSQTDLFLLAENKVIYIKNIQTGAYELSNAFVPSWGSLFLLLYFIPTLATGLASKFKPMIWGGVLGIIFFIISCFTSTKIDLLLHGFSGIFCWLIPGIILFRKYKKVKNEHV